MKVPSVMKKDVFDWLFRWWTEFESISSDNFRDELWKHE